jgi:dTDP-4-dehydrorhamnose reductase
MRVLVCGAHGQVGSELMRRAPEWAKAIGVGSAELDVTAGPAALAVIKEVNPELIINAAAYTAVDKAESEIQRAYAVNCDGVELLAREAERLAIPLFHISTDYVFAGDSTMPYREDQPTYPAGVYGASKLAGERVLDATCSRYVVMRTSWVFGSHGTNFVKTMLRLGREREELSVVADQHGCPTSARSIADALWQLAESYRQHGSLEWGCYHFAGRPACTWHAFAAEIFRQAFALGMLQREPKVKAIATEQYPTPAKRPLWSVLDSGKLERTYGVYPADWRSELSQVLTELSSC